MGIIAHSRDTRTPTSVHVIDGRFTVKIYDESAYIANISQYYGDQPPAEQKRHHYRIHFTRKKCGSGWSAGASLTNKGQLGDTHE